MAEARILVVDDSALELERCRAALDELPEVTVAAVSRSSDALTLLGSESFDVLVTDLRMPLVDGLDLVRVAQAHDPDMPVLMLTGYPSVDTALSALKAGAADYLTKPVHAGELQAVVTRVLEGRRLKRENRLLERRLDPDGGGVDMVGASAVFVDLLDVVRRLAHSDLDILVVGETGTGKELVARRIHQLSVQGRGRFVGVDCGTIPEHLLESELYGHEKGAFTGADSRSMGLVEYADGGTLFLDEVQSLPPQLQAKLLRVLQERCFRRVGGTAELKAHVRVVAALNEDPEELIRLGRLREDLYHRLNVGRIEVPPLRDRAGDVRLLAHHFVSRYRPPDGGVEGISDEAITVLERYTWPDNVRELQNTLRRSLALATGGHLTSADLPSSLTRGAPPGGAADIGPFQVARDRHLAEFERSYLRAILREVGGDVAAAARRSGISRATLYRLLSKHALDPDHYRTRQDD